MGEEDNEMAEAGPSRLVHRHSSGIRRRRLSHGPDESQSQPQSQSMIGNYRSDPPSHGPVCLALGLWALQKGQSIEHTDDNRLDCGKKSGKTYIGSRQTIGVPNLPITSPHPLRMITSTSNPPSAPPHLIQLQTTRYRTQS